MGSVNIRWLLLVLIPAFFAGCGGMMNDLNPSSSDKQVSVQAGTIGPHVGQNAPGFTIYDTLGTSITLSSALTETGVKGLVLYFTMWCPTCDIHMSSMRSSRIPLFSNVRFYAVDYVSGTVADARNSELSNGYEGSGFIVLADTTQTVMDLYNGTMGTTVVIDKTGIIRMNEDYKDDRLSAALTALP
jgi:peroxiredoxin